MLSGMTKWVISRTEHLSLIGRNRDKLKRLGPLSEQNHVKFISVDYHNTDHLQQTIRNFIRKFGAIDYLITWIHGSAPKAIPTILKEISQFQDDEWRFFHVKGSSTNIDAIHQTIKVPNMCLYREVKLGFVIEENHSRWLTHDEICNGVMNAIIRDNVKTTIGTIEPWSRRP